MRGALAVVGVALAFGLAGPAAAVAQDPDLAGEWHLDSIAGGTTPDTSGHGDAGHVGGTPTTVADGRFGRRPPLPGQGQRINAGNFATLQPSNVSVLAWVRSSSTPGNVKNIVAQGGQVGCSFASYAMYTGGSTDNSPTSGASASTSTTAPRRSARHPRRTTIWDGHWHAVLGTYDGTTVRLYVDGTEVGARGRPTGAIRLQPRPHQRLLDRRLRRRLAVHRADTVLRRHRRSPRLGPWPDRRRGRLRLLDDCDLPAGAPDPRAASAAALGPTAEHGRALDRPVCHRRRPDRRRTSADKGMWKNVPSSGFTYRWIANENGKAVPIGQGGPSRPTSAIYGYPITCEVTVQGPTAPISATSNSVFFTSAGLNKLPQPLTATSASRGSTFGRSSSRTPAPRRIGYPSGTFTTYCGGGTPTAFVPIPRTFFCSPGANPQDAMQHTDYCRRQARLR